MPTDNQDFETKFVQRFTSFDTNVDVGSMKKYIDKEEMLVFVQQFFAIEISSANFAELIAQN